jgi:UDP-N-acetylmuramoyl-tripeptide--D-alanyl-D-alanine ligase
MIASTRTSTSTPACTPACTPGVKLAAFWRIDTLAAHVRGAWLAAPRRQPNETPLILQGLSTDTRAVTPGQVFLALKGEKHDAHAFLADAMDKGAAALIIQDESAWHAARTHPRAGQVGVVLVRDTAAALLDLGAAYRRVLSAIIVAIGGSNGKTTTVRLVHAALAGAGGDAVPGSGGLRVRCSAKSFNNAIGVPLTLLSAQSQDQALICEVGTNAPGELAPLAEIVEPDLALITSLGREHLEGLGDLSGVAREEASLLRGLRDGGVAIVNADSPELLAAVHDEVARAAKAGRVLRLHTFGFAPNADTRVATATQSLDGLTFTLADGTRWRLPLLGEHNASNAAGAIAAARALGLADPNIAAGLALAQGPPMRLERSVIATSGAAIHVVNDCYNANPDSTLAALRAFAAFAANAPRRVVVLGDMLELGPTGPALHAEVLVAATNSLKPHDQIVLVGPIWQQFWQQPRNQATARASPNTALIPTLSNDTLPSIAALIQPADALLLKGSRGMSLERILTTLKQRWPQPPATTITEPKSSLSTPTIR